MSKRIIIEIDEDACNGCGACESECPEGALKVIGGKARLVGESLCDGLGACIGRCPKNAISVTERETSDYDEVAVLKGILPLGKDLLAAHFAHLDRHGQDLYLAQAAEYLRTNGLEPPRGFERLRKIEKPQFTKPACRSFSLREPAANAQDLPGTISSPQRSKNWPIQLHLVNPHSPRFEGTNLAIEADCTAFVMGTAHEKILDGRALVIACPKLDHDKDSYLVKLAVLLAQAASVSVVTMEVPCCAGLLRLVEEARRTAGVDLPLQSLVIGINGGLVSNKMLP